MSANRPHLAFLQHAQKLHLHRRGHVTNFVQEDRALLGGFEQAFAVCGRAGERTFDVTKQFGFQKRFSECTAVDRDKRL